MNELGKNIESEIGMLKEIAVYSRRMGFANESDKKILQETIVALKEGIKIINNAIPEIVKGMRAGLPLPDLPKLKVESVTLSRVDYRLEVFLNSKDKSKFLKELSISEQLLKKLRRRKKGNKDEEYSEFKPSRGYVRLGNKLFLETANRLLKKGYFKSLYFSLKKANLDMLLEVYVAMMLLTIVSSFIAGIFIFLIVFFLDFGLAFPFVSLYDGSYLDRLLQTFWIPIALPLISFISIYFYPSTEKNSIGRRIDQELPFAVIHMSAISGSGIAPSELFKIIIVNRDFPYLRKEIRKVINQINLYGYDLVTALNNASKGVPSEKLSELFSGMSATITSGASITDFLQKRSENLLLGYRLEREKYTKLVETFLDIYISVVIAAPMIFLLLLILISISGASQGFTPSQLTLLAVMSISFLNVLFLIFLQVKQPSY